MAAGSYDNLTTFYDNLTTFYDNLTTFYDNLTTCLFFRAFITSIISMRCGVFPINFLGAININ